MRFLASFMIWLFLWLPVAILGIPVVAILLLTNWDGATTWWGNYLHPRGINTGRCTLWQQFEYMALRNPCSNFGKYVIGVSPMCKWAWYVDGWCRYGWSPTPDSRDNSRKFYFNPFRLIHKNG